MNGQSKHVIAVFGGSRATPTSLEYAHAYDTGKLLARAGFVVMNGGYAGTMEASARGAKENGGATLGILAREFGDLAPNAYLDEYITREDLFARIREMHARADGFIVLKGSMGTLAELAIVWNLAKIDGKSPKPIVLVGEWWKPVLESWRDHLAVTKEEAELLTVVAQPAEAVAFLARVVPNGDAPSPRAPSSET